MDKHKVNSFTSGAGSMSNKNKIIVIILLIALIICGYLAVANVARLWPFQLKNETASTLKSPEQLKAPEPKRNITLVTPSIQQVNGVETLIVKTKVDTDEQGDCALTLANDKTAITLPNSTKDIDGKTGCLDWNINASQIKAGRYDLKIEFVSESKELSILEESLTIK